MSTKSLTKESVPHIKKNTSSAQHTLSRKSVVQKWLQLAASVLLLWFCIFLIAPWLQSKSKTLKNLADYIDASGIDAGALYYTEVDEVSDADLMVRDTFRFFLAEQK